jgi:hypothetical protein
MAAIIFPQNPRVNDTCQADNSTWKFDGVRWRRLPSDVPLSRLSTDDAEIGDVLVFDGEKYSPVPPFSNTLEVGNLQIPDNLVGITLRINNAPFGTIPKELYPVNGKNFYLAHFIYQENNEEEDWQVFYDGGRWCAIWSYYGEGFGIAQASFAAVGNTTYPWQATGWTNGGIVNRIGTYDAALAPAPLGEDAYSGVGTKAAREDHVHPLPTPANIGAATAAQGAKADTAVQSLDAYDSIIANQLEKRGVVAISAAELRLTGETQIANPNDPNEDIDVQGAHLIALKGTVSGGTITWEVGGQGAFRSAIDAVSHTELATKQDAGNYATLESGKVPAEQLPSYVDDVLEYKDRSVFPSTGEIGKIYVAVNGGIISATQYDNTQGFWGSNQILLVSQDGVYRGGTIRFENTGAIIIVSSGGGNDSGQPSGGYTSGVAVIGGGTRIIITASTPQVYRWSGTTYIEIAPTPTPYSIGAATAAQGAIADSALQPAALAPYRTSAAQDIIDAGKAPALSSNPVVASLAAGLYDEPNGSVQLQIRNSQVIIGNNLVKTTFRSAIGAATAEQGAKADTALQAGAPISNISGLQTALDGKQVSGSYAPSTNIAPSAITGTAVITTDTRLSDSRQPTAHKSTHATGNTDALTPADIGAAGTSTANTFSQPQIITGTSASAMLRVTQEGSGEAIRVEDSPTPDSTAFVVNKDGRVGVGIAPDATVGLSVDSTGIKFSNGSIQTVASSGVILVEVNTTANIVGTMVGNTFTVTATGVFTTDGYTPVLGDIVAFISQSTTTQNGFWQVSVVGAVGVQAVFIRPIWFSVTAKNTMFIPRFGTSQAGYVMALAGPFGSADITVGTSALLITRVNARLQNATIGTNVFSGVQTFRANASGAGSCPFLFQSGATLMTTPVANAVEWFGDVMYLTTNAGVRTTNVTNLVVPATSTSAGVAGQIAVDNANSFLYVCTAANVWKRVLLTTF